MLLTIDVGNTNTVLGVFRGEELIANWRLTTARQQTIDEYGVLTRNLFTLAGLDRDSINGVIISSVVPPVNWTLAEMSRIYFGQKALFVEAGVKTGMAVLVDNPLEVGADRIVNGVAAFHKYGGPCIVVDFGTAITFDAISARGEYLGGVIAPGLGIASEALFARAARLPRVEIKDPGKVIGTNTVTHMQAGLYYGAVDMVDGMLTRMKAELGGEVKVLDPDGNTVLLGQRERSASQAPTVGDEGSVQFSLLREAAAVVAAHGGTSRACQVHDADGRSCPSRAEVKLADSLGDMTWVCLIHAEEILVTVPAAFIASQGEGGIAAFLARH